MSLYYFNYQTNITSLDDHGTEIADLKGLRKEAVRASQEFFVTGEANPEFWEGEPAKVWVTDGPSGSGNTVLTMELSVRN
jgi:hypothetical protein